MNQLIHKYLNKNFNNELSLISKPNALLELIVVIPAYKENFETISKTLLSLIDSVSSTHIVEVLILFNCGPHEDVIFASHQSVIAKLSNWFKINNTASLNFHCFNHQFDNAKKAGVGSARKLLMDFALSRFSAIEHNGIIVNLDADTRVEKGYFNLILSLFRLTPNVDAVGFHFEHPLDESLTKEENEAIIQYELHLRYFINMQRSLKLPFAFQTIGSAMAVRAEGYAKEGGMVRKQAGEDFYFLHKFIKKNKFSDLNEVTVYPSGRTSDRVPFGTGKAVADQISNNIATRMTYDYESFEHLKNCLNIKFFYTATILQYQQFFSDKQEGVSAYFTAKKVIDKLKEIKLNTTDFQSFYKRYFQWFDAFQLMKYLHHMRDHSFPDIDLDKAIAYFVKSENLPLSESNIENLETLRSFDKSRNYASEVQALIRALE